MSRMLLHSASALALSILPVSAAVAQADAPLTDIITVSGHPLAAVTSDDIDPATLPPSGPDAAGLVARLPGAALVGNGALSGQVQYRGLSGARVNVRIDGQMFDPGGPNLMDPPLHYAPIALIDRIEVDRGVSPVRNGPGLAGGLNAVFKHAGFAPTGDWAMSYDLTAATRSADDSYSAGGLVGAANDRVRIELLGSREAGGDISFPGGTIGGSQHERLVYGTGMGFRAGVHEFSLDLRRQETGPTGNPPFAMDIRYFDSDFARAAYQGSWSGLDLNAHVETAEVQHAMNNFSLRPAPVIASLYRETLATAKTVSGGGDAGFAALGGDMRIGFDAETADHDVTITNSNNAGFFLNTLPAITMARSGVFAEWSGAAGAWNAELGLRADRHSAEAGTASIGAAVPAMPGMLAMNFNALDRRQDDITLDAVARLWRPLSDGTTLRLTLARKTRAPGYVERFAWLPTEASGGLADGNTYVGDVNLVPETAWIAEAGIDWSSGFAYARPTIFYRRVDDYIQGVAYDSTPGVINTPVEMVSSMNGDPTPLRFANVDADLWGLDVDFGTRIDAHWRLDGVLSLVRGDRRDIDDHLYRVAPPSLTLAGTYQTQDWSASLEMIAVSEQSQVSATNAEAVTPGHVLVNLTGHWAISSHVNLTAGIENLLDRDFDQHLAGYNRNAGSDVGLGERLPGTGRSFGLRLNLRG